MNSKYKTFVAATLVGLTARLSGTVYGQASLPENRVATTTTSQSVDLVLSRFEAQFIAAADAMPSMEYDFNPGSLGVPGANFKGGARLRIRGQTCGRDELRDLQRDERSQA